MSRNRVNAHRRCILTYVSAAEAREAAEAMHPVADAVLEGMRSQEAHDARSLELSVNVLSRMMRAIREELLPSRSCSERWSVVRRGVYAILRCSYKFQKQQDEGRWPANPARGWCRDLCAEGIEPHPGPGVEPRGRLTPGAG